MTSLDSASDAILTERAADGDVQAFASIVRRHGPVLRGHAIRILGSTSESDDVVQDTFITAWIELPNLRDGTVLRPWLVRIASRKALDRVRVRREHADIDDHDAPAPIGHQPAHRVESSALDNALQRALSTLPEEQQRCWLLREMGGYSYAEIAAELRIPPSTVRGLIARARKALILKMEAWR